MKAGRSLPWLLLGAGVVTLLALALFGSQEPPPSTHSSTSDAADGTSALARAASATGHRVDRLRAAPAARGGLLFIFSPSQPYSSLEASIVARYVVDGGVVVYASEQPDPALEAEFRLTRDTNQVRDVVAYPPGPLLPGVQEVSGGAAAQPFIATTADEVPLLRGPRQEILGVEIRRGKGIFIALADPLLLCNGYLLRSDNARFMADLLGLAPAGSEIAFDESHHQAGAVAAPAQPVGGVAPWIAAIIWAVAVFYVGLALRGRAFGPPVPLSPPRARSSAEYVEAVSTLLRRSGGRRQALDILAEATLRAVRGRRRAPGTEDEVARLAAAGEGSEAGLLDAARHLHRLAFPERRA